MSFPNMELTTYERGIITPEEIAKLEELRGVFTRTPITRVDIRIVAKLGFSSRRAYATIHIGDLLSIGGYSVLKLGDETLVYSPDVLLTKTPDYHLYITLEIKLQYKHEYLKWKVGI